MYNRDWDEAYRGTPPWDIGYPQPALEALVKSGEIKPGMALDVGCGTGENAILLAKNGCTVTGIDLAEDAIRKARAKAKERNAKIDFIVGNVLELDRYFSEGKFDIVIDFGLFHVMTDEERPIFARQVDRALKRGGSYYMMCFSDKEPGDRGPRRVSKEEIKQAFYPFFRLNYIKEATFMSRIGDQGRSGYLLSATKTGIGRSL